MQLASGLTAHQVLQSASPSSAFLGRVQFLHTVLHLADISVASLSGRSGTGLGLVGHQLAPGDVKGLAGQSAELPSGGLCLPNTEKFWTERAGQMQKLLFTGLSQTIQHSRFLNPQANTYSSATDLGAMNMGIKTLQLH